MRLQYVLHENKLAVMYNKCNIYCKNFQKGVYNCTDGYRDHGKDAIVTNLPASGIKQDVSV